MECEGWGGRGLADRRAAAHRDHLHHRLDSALRRERHRRSGEESGGGCEGGDDHDCCGVWLGGGGRDLIISTPCHDYIFYIQVRTSTLVRSHQSTSLLASASCVI